MPALALLGARDGEGLRSSTSPRSTSPTGRSSSPPSGLLAPGERLRWCAIPWSARADAIEPARRRRAARLSPYARSTRCNAAGDVRTARRAGLPVSSRPDATRRPHPHHRHRGPCDRDRLRCPADARATTATTRRLETKLGLDLRGGLRIEYQVLPAEGKAPTRDDLASCARSSSTASTSRASPSPRSSSRATTGSSSRCRASRTPTRSATSSAPPAASTSSRSARPRWSRTRTSAAMSSRPSATRPTTELCVLFSGDQVAAAHDRRQRDRPADGQLHAHRRGQGQVRRSTRRTTSATTSRSSSTARSSPRRSSTSSIPNGQVEIAVGRHRRLPARGGPEPRHDPPVRPAAVPDRRARQHHRQPDARRGVPPAEPARGR